VGVAAADAVGAAAVGEGAAAAAEAAVVDRVGIGFRPSLAAGIFAHLDAIDVVEVLAEDWCDRPRSEQRALATLSAQVPLYVHATTLGMASVSPVEEDRLGRVARLVERARPVAWSEHLAFVRAGGIEIGHLAAPPRTEATVAGTARNLARARAIVGSTPFVENVATLVDAPSSVMDEASWVAAIGARSEAPLLLDLHNLYANATNFGFDPSDYLDRIDACAIGLVHVAGGRLVTGSDGRARILDDHLHAVPSPVYELLAALAARTPNPLTVVLERDGDFPPMRELLVEIEAVRAALARGRAMRERDAHPFRGMGGTTR
jgi:uncharacterized protein (UPF0276 family)